MKIDVENILNRFISFSKNIAADGDSRLISFAFSIEDSIDQISIDILKKSFSQISLFFTADKNQKIIGIDSAIEISLNSENNFASLSDQYFSWGTRITSNWDEKDNYNPKLIFCSVKFDKGTSSELWKDFDPISIYVPQLVIIEESAKTTGYINFIGDQNMSIDVMHNKLKEYLTLISITASQNTETKSFNYSELINSSKNDLSNWETAAYKAIEKIKIKELDKLVLSRLFKFDLNSEIKWDSLILKLQRRFPDCYLFFLKKNNSIFFGSSPEMFLRVLDGSAEVESVAGSAARGEKIESDDELERFLKSSEKNHREHLFVSEYITDRLLKFSNDVKVIEEKQIRKLDNIQHLLTKISAKLNSKQILFNLIDSLFPTPAVCGVPKSKSFETIKNLETYDRGLYSGLVGVFDFKGNCELAVSIRSAIVKNMQVTAFAGAGLVNNSDPKEEFQETNLKLNTILSLFTDENESKQK